MVFHNYKIEVRLYRNFLNDLGDDKFEKESVLIHQAFDAAEQLIKDDLEFEEDSLYLKDADEHFSKLIELSRQFPEFMFMISSEYDMHWGIISDGNVHFEIPYDLLSGNCFSTEYQNH